GGVDPEAFLLRLRDAISIDHFTVGLIKAPVMAAVIGIVACVEGLAVEGSAESLGRHTTASVVKGIFFVIVMDGLVAILFASTGMGPWRRLPQSPSSGFATSRSSSARHVCSMASISM